MQRRKKKKRKIKYKRRLKFSRNFNVYIRQEFLMQKGEKGLKMSKTIPVEPIISDAKKEG